MSLRNIARALRAYRGEHSPGLPNGGHVSVPWTPAAEKELLQLGAKITTVDGRRHVSVRIDGVDLYTFAPSDTVVSVDDIEDAARADASAVAWADREVG